MYVGGPRKSTRFKFMAMMTLVFTLRLYSTSLSFFWVVHYRHNFFFHESPRRLCIIHCLNRVHERWCCHQARHLHKNVLDAMCFMCCCNSTNNHACICCMDFKLSSLIRYLKRDLVIRKAIAKKSLPRYLASWIDKSSGMCVIRHA